jgi:amino acid transporter
MKARYLLPASFRQIGWFILVPSLLLGIAVMHFDFEIEGFEVAFTESFYMNSVKVREKPMPNNLTNELAAIAVLAGAFFVAFSREKTEDEWVSQVRLESLQ